MGSTVLAGALTSIFSGFFLRMCSADALNTFGDLLLVTVTASMLTALVLLPSLLFLIGPSGKQG